MTKEEMLKFVIEQNGEYNYYTSWFRTLVQDMELSDDILYHAMIFALCNGRMI